MSAHSCLINKVSAREILDSRGNPTVEAEVWLRGGVRASASSPSGASTGKFEALELRDNDLARYGGKGVSKAVQNIVKVISPALEHSDVSNQESVDKKLIELDGTPNKSRLGANATLAVSLAVARAASLCHRQPLYQYLSDLFNDGKTSIPRPMMNFINGGRHADTNLEIQEVMAIPNFQKSGNIDFTSCLEAGASIFHKLEEILKKNNMDTDLGNEGGFAPIFENPEQPIQLLLEAVAAAGYQAGVNVDLGLDVAASEFFKDGIYRFNKQDYSSGQLIDLYQDWINKYYILSIEDGLDQEDWKGWSQMTRVLGNKNLMVGDDLFVTNKIRLQRGIDEKSANAIIIKPNQIGTLSEAVEAMQLAKSAGLKTIVSHRSGETMDDFITDLAVGLKADFIKAGSVARGERVAKYNRLLAIEQELNK